MLHEVLDAAQREPARPRKRVHQLRSLRVVGLVAGPALLRPRLQAALHVRVGDDNEAPVLNVLTGGRADRRVRQLEEDLLGNRIGLEPAQSTHRVHGAEEIRAFFVQSFTPERLFATSI